MMIPPQHPTNPFVLRTLMGIPLAGGAVVHRVDSIREVERLPLRLYRGYCSCGHFTRRTLTANKAHKLIVKHI
jgi:hypothetical protein